MPFAILYYTTLRTLCYSKLLYTSLHCTAALHTTQHYSTPLYTTLHYTTVHHTTLLYTSLHLTALHYTSLHCTTLQCIIIHNTALHLITLHYTTASLAWWLRRPPRERKIPGLNPACAGIFSGSSHTSDSKIATPVATLPGAWHYRVSTWTVSVYCDWVR